MGHQNQNTFFLFDHIVPTQWFILLYILIRGLQLQTGIQASGIKMELESLFRYAWFPTRSSIDKALDNAVHSNLLSTKNSDASVWYYTTTGGLFLLHNHGNHILSVLQNGIQCLDAVINLVFPKPTSEHSQARPNQGPMLTSPLLDQLVILALLRNWRDKWLSTEEICFAYESQFPQIKISPSTIHTHLSRLQSLMCVTTVEHNETTYYQIALHGIARLKFLQHPENGIFARIMAIRKGLVEILRVAENVIGFPDKKKTKLFLLGR